MKELIQRLYAIGAIKFGSFEIKRDFLSPFQVDMSPVISHPTLAKEVCVALAEKAKNLTFDLMAGTPIAGACFANYIAWENECPLLAIKPEGIAKVVGSYKSGQNCLVLHDVLLNGSGVLDTIDHLEEEGVVVRDVLSFLDLGLGGKKQIKSRNYVVHSVLSIADAIQILHDSGKLGGDHFKLATDFLENA